MITNSPSLLPEKCFILIDYQLLRIPLTEHLNVYEKYLLILKNSIKERFIYVEMYIVACAYVFSVDVLC